jgi:hypothetical protein
MIPKRFGRALERACKTVLLVADALPRDVPESGRAVPHYLQSREPLQATLPLCSHPERVDMVDRFSVSF